MKIKSLGLKISLIVAVLVAVIVVVVMVVVVSGSDGLVTDLTGKAAKAANLAFESQVQSLEDEALTFANFIAGDVDVINALSNRDADALTEVINRLEFELDSIAVCDANGVVIARSNDDRRGDNISNLEDIHIALTTGTGISTIERGAFSSLSTCGSAAIRDYNGDVIGAVTCAHDLTNPKYVDLVKEYSNCEATLFDADTRVNSTLKDDRGNRVIGTQASDAVRETVLNNQQEYETQIVLFGHTYAATYSPLVVDGVSLGMLFTGVNIDDTLADRQSMINTVLWLSIAIGVVAIALVFLFNVVSVSKPLKKIGEFADKIRNGDLGLSSTSVSTVDVRSADEVGTLARALEHAYAQLRGYVGEIKERMQGLADGDLATECLFEFQGDFIMIKDSINMISQNLNRTMTEVNASTSQVSTGAKQVADGAQALAQGSTEQAASIEELSASISEIAEKTKKNADIAGRAARLADTIRDNAEQGNRQMDEMIGAVKGINQSSQSISKVIKVIDDIAFQTNILALNAAVEAARAGQHGKGFAVVAEEVRNLASKSAEAAKDTGSLIQDSVEKAELGVHIAERTAASLTEIVSGINESSELIREIADASDEQSRSTKQITVGIDQVAQVVQQNSATAQESAAASEEMSGLSGMLQDLVSRFRLKDGGMVRSLPVSVGAGRAGYDDPDAGGYDYPRADGGFGKY